MPQPLKPVRSESVALRDRLIDRLRPTLTAARRLTTLDLPPGLVAEFEGPGGLARLQPAAVLVPILEETQVVLTRRSQSMRAHPGQISFPGGRRDPGDRDSRDNALREAEEEIGLDSSRVEIIGYLDDYPTISGYLVTPVVGLIHPGAAMRADGTEVAELLQAPLDYLLDSRNYQRRSLQREGLEISYYEISYGDMRIWGATAGMLYNLCQIAGAAAA